MANVKDLKDYVETYDFMEEEIENEQKEDFTDYLHRKIPCQFKIDAKKKQYYDDICSTDTNVCVKTPLLTSSIEFIFGETLADGRLLIPDRDDNEDFQNACINNTFLDNMRSLLKFREAYNINLSNSEEIAILQNLCLEKKQKHKPLRGADGKFIKQNDIPLEHSIKNSNEGNCTKQAEAIPLIHTVNNFETKNILPDISDISNLSDTFMFNDFREIDIGYNDQPENCSKAFEVVMDKSFHTLGKKTNNTLKLFRPFKDYWMYRCTFSRVKPKNFELFEKMLPRSFRWLLNECASVIEMSPEDLYEEVCLVEAYYANVSEQLEIHTNANAGNRKEAHFDAILKRW